LAMPWASLIVSELAKGRGLTPAWDAVGADGWLTLATPILPGPVEKLPEVELGDCELSAALVQVRLSLPQRFEAKLACAPPLCVRLSMVFVKLALIRKL